ncbi:MAG: peptide deformylase [Bacteroidota bacterium]|nr:peptide deformylase [Bacteroidota bacterium]
MILPIVAYGDPVLKKKATEISSDYPDLKTLIANMYETMYGAYGVGLAAPQVGLSIRLFLVDTAPFSEDESLSVSEAKALKGFKKTFINPEIIEQTGEEWNFNEGCLSIPSIREEVSRKPQIKIRYQDTNFKSHIEVYDGLIARVIQHEYDHIQGILFTDKVSNFKKRLLKSKLSSITKGKISTDYRMRFPKTSKKRV